MDPSTSSLLQHLLREGGDWLESSEVGGLLEGGPAPLILGGGNGEQVPTSYSLQADVNPRGFCGVCKTLAKPRYHNVPDFQVDFQVPFLDPTISIPGGAGPHRWV